MEDNLPDPRAIAKAMLAQDPAPPEHKHLSLQAAAKFRGKFVACAWYLGASWSQLGGLYGIRRESIMAQANKWLPPHRRQGLDRQRISYEHLSEIQDAWDTLFRTRPALIQRLDVVKLSIIVSQLAIRDDESLDPRAADI